MYWLTDELFYTPILQKAIMTRNRFQLILNFLHFNDNANPTFDINNDGRDRLHKVVPFTELLRVAVKEYKHLVRMSALMNHYFNSKVDYFSNNTLQQNALFSE